jgi:isocitrate dehydrogenase (NAD+)
MITGNQTKTKLFKMMKRTYTSATHLPIPNKPRDLSVSICPGEGVGPQLTESVLQIFDYLKVPLKTESIEYSSLKRDQGNPELKNNKNLLLGPVSDKTIEEENKGICHSQILEEMDVFASVINAISIPGIDTKGKDVDLLIIQQADKGFQSKSGAEYDDVSTCWITPCVESKTIAQYALNNALMSQRSKITALHQANIQKECHGEFLINMRKATKDQKGIQYKELNMSDAIGELLKDPEAFELIVLPIGCGNAIQNIAMSLVGGSSIVPSVHIGDKYTIFEQGGNNPCYGKVKDKTANPTGLILAASMMLRQVCLPSYADLIEEAVFKTYENPEIRTPELGGNYSTTEFTNKLIQNLHVRQSRYENESEEEPALVF